MKKILGSLLIASVAFVSCQKDDNGANCPVTPVSPVNLRFVKPTGADLLNSNTGGSYNPANLKIWFVENGTPVNMSTNVFHIGTTDSLYLASTFELASSGGRTFYIQLTPTDIDTLYVRNDLEKDANGCNVFTFKDFTYNGAAVSRSASYLPGGFFQIVKR